MTSVDDMPVTRAIVAFWPQSLRRRLHHTLAGTGFRVNATVTVGDVSLALRAFGHPELAGQVTAASKWWMATR